MLVLSRADVEVLLTMDDAVAALEDGFRQLALGGVTMPQRAATRIEPHNGLHLSMPAYVGGEREALTIKIVTVYADNPARHGLPMIQGVLLLYDAANGQLLAMMDAEHLTAVRTGAASGVATKHLAREDAATVALFGAGAQAGAQLAAVCAVRPIRRATVLTRTGAKDAAFCAQMAEQLDIEVTSGRDVRAAVEGADIICTATNSATPLFDGAWLQPGVHINAVGAYTAQMREVDTAAVQRAKVYVDRHEAARAEAGDIMIPVTAGELSYDHVTGELGEVLVGQAPGRTGADDITLFKSVGLAMQDAVTAPLVYAQAVEEDMGHHVAL